MKDSDRWPPVSSVFLRVLCGSKVWSCLAAAFLQLLNYALQIRIACAKASSEPVSTALHHCLAIGQHFKLAGLARCNHGVNAQPFFDQGHETRDLGFIVLSRRAGTYLDIHSVLQGAGILRVFPDQRYQCKSAVSFWFSDLPITCDHPMSRSGQLPIPSAHFLWYSHRFFAGM